MEEMRKLLKSSFTCSCCFFSLLTMRTQKKSTSIFRTTFSKKRRGGKSERKIDLISPFFIQIPNVLNFFADK